MLIPPHLTAMYKHFRPAHERKSAKESFIGEHLTWLGHLRTLLTDGSGANHAEDIEALKRLVLKVDTQYDNTFDLDQILADIRNVGRSPNTVTESTHDHMPNDTIVQAFPGGDHAEMPADRLLMIKDAWEPKEPSVISVQSMVICRDTRIFRGFHIPFTMGVIAAPVHVVAGIDVVIQWWIPPQGKERVAGGHTRDTVDLFGAWRAFDELSVEEAGACTLPPASVPSSSIILGPIDLVEGMITHKTLDTIIELDIDITGLTWTRTDGGNAFRQYRLYTD